MINKKEIEKKTKEVLLKYNMFNIPVDPVLLAKKLSVEVKNAVFDDSSLSGMIAKRDKKAVILVNINDSPYRKRFTIAHELGHFFLHLEKAGEFVDTITDLFRGDLELELQEDKRPEVEANYFAASLLMNEELLRNKWDELKDIDILSSVFKVSREAMSIRLNNLGLL